MSDHKNKKNLEDGAPPVPAWFLTYADTVTLLMTFFVMLMSFSTLDEDNYEKVKGSLAAHLGMVDNMRLSRDSLLLRRMLATSRMFTEGYENPPAYDPIKDVADDVEVRVRKTSLANVLDYKLTDRGLEIHVLASDLFEEGTADFVESSPRTLRLVAGAVRHLPHRLLIEGRPDAFFVRSSAAETPEELAMNRAAAVCRFLNARAGVVVDRLAAAAEVSQSRDGFTGAGECQLSVVVQRPLNRKAVR